MKIFKGNRGFQDTPTTHTRVERQQTKQVAFFTSAQIKKGEQLSLLAS